MGNFCNGQGGNFRGDGSNCCGGDGGDVAYRFGGSETGGS